MLLSAVIYKHRLHRMRVWAMANLTLGVLLLGEPLNAWIGMVTLLVLGGVYLASQHGDGNGLRHQR
jgi:drug/metabolite transporter (DMT)-like permease